MKCKDCKWCDIKHPSLSAGYAGFCRKTIGVVEMGHGEYFATWGQVHLEHDWCGEFKNAKSEVANEKTKPKRNVGMKRLKLSKNEIWGQ